MKFLIDIKDSRRGLFLKLVKNLDYVTTIKEVEKEKEDYAAHLADLRESFNDIKLHRQGKKVLQSAEDFLKKL